MDSCNSDWAFLSRVPPFGYLRLIGYLLLTAAFRSLSRPSSAPGAKASSLRSSSLDHQFKLSLILLTSWSDPLSLAEDSCCLTCCLLLLLKLIRVRISSLIFLSFQISFCLFDNFRYPFWISRLSVIKISLNNFVSFDMQFSRSYQFIASRLTVQVASQLMVLRNLWVLSSSFRSLWKPNSITSEKFVP